jgi:hypothetical protein
VGRRKDRVLRALTTGMRAVRRVHGRRSLNGVLVKVNAETAEPRISNESAWTTDRPGETVTAKMTSRTRTEFVLAKSG